MEYNYHIDRTIIGKSFSNIACPYIEFHYYINFKEFDRRSLEYYIYCKKSFIAFKIEGEYDDYKDSSWMSLKRVTMQDIPSTYIELELENEVNILDVETYIWDCEAWQDSPKGNLVAINLFSNFDTFFFRIVPNISGIAFTTSFEIFDSFYGFMSSIKDARKVSFLK